jgi:hypothetical protein
MTDWNSVRLKQAYALVEAERAEQAQPPESGIDEALRTALEAIEIADMEAAK